MTSTHNTEHATNKYGTTIEPGQIWADNDPRAKGRTLEITDIEHGTPTKAVCTVLTELHGKTPDRPRTVRITIDRLHPTSNGYKLIREP